MIDFLFGKHSTACILCIFINCPFANGVASVDDITVLLLDKLQVFSGSGTSNMLNGGHLSNGVGNKDASFVYAHSSLFCLDKDMGSCVDILSLLEVVACVMRWKWRCSNVVAPLVKILDSSVTEHVSSSVITLLGQLGRIGIDAKGYSDFGVEKLIAAPFEEIIGSDSDPSVGVISQSLSVVSVLGSGFFSCALSKCHP